MSRAAVPGLRVVFAQRLQQALQALARIGLAQQAAGLVGDLLLRVGEEEGHVAAVVA